MNVFDTIHKGMTARRGRTTAALLVLAFSLTGCAPKAEVPDMTPHESRRHAEDLVRATISLVSRADNVSTGDWTYTTGGATPEPCWLPDRQIGVYYNSELAGPPTSRGEIMVSLVEKFWKERGLRTLVLYRPNRKLRDNITVLGRGDSLDGVMFTITDAQPSILGSSACVPGAYYKLLDEAPSDPHPTE
jgi:hypothetical protein